MKRDSGLGRVLLTPVAGIYFIIVKTRNLLYDWGILRSFTPSTPTICVGNLTVGGTGKTPHIEFLLDELSKKYRVAVLSRGYKRKTKGYHEVAAEDTPLEAGDEPLQIKQKFPRSVVAVHANRKEGINQIVFSHPDTQIILLDDAYQHRKIAAGFNILLIDFNRPTWEDRMLPAGNLRDTNSQIKRANAVIITKCPADMKPLEKRLLKKKLNLYPYQSLLFSHIDYAQPTPAFAAVEPFKKPKKVLAVTGIADPTPFLSHLESLYADIEHIAYPDHHNFSASDIAKMLEVVNRFNESYSIITTEKDAKRLTAMELPAEIKNYLYFVPIKVRLSDDSNCVLISKIEKYVRENTSYRRLHKGQN